MRHKLSFLEHTDARDALRMIRLPALSPLEHAAFVAAGLLVYVITTRARQQRRHPYAALAWAFAISLARVVLPTPGGPHKIIEWGLPD